MKTTVIRVYEQRLCYTWHVKYSTYLLMCSRQYLVQLQELTVPNRVLDNATINEILHSCPSYVCQQLFDDVIKDVCQYYDVDTSVVIRELTDFRAIYKQLHIHATMDDLIRVTSTISQDNVYESQYASTNDQLAGTFEFADIEQSAV